MPFGESEARAMRENYLDSAGNMGSSVLHCSVPKELLIDSLLLFPGLFETVLASPNIYIL